MEIYSLQAEGFPNETSGLVYGYDDLYLTLDDDRLNLSFGNSSGNGTDGLNHTYVIVRDGLYPSGYSLLQIVAASIVATLLMIVVVVGNMLVIIAIATEKALKNIQNWFIASLAVADFFLGLVIMPFSLANEVMGYWIFGNWWCDVHSAMDVLLCTASIMNLCLISLDRYWSITQAVDYLKKRTPARAAVMITLVWILSGLICIPPLLGWKVDRPIEDYPKCQASQSTPSLTPYQQFCCFMKEDSKAQFQTVQFENRKTGPSAIEEYSKCKSKHPFPHHIPGLYRAILLFHKRGF
ncbi:alpha-2 adrenergic receptor-like [Bacillus rossius redtenbacheri]|uniref:alpha-2 adrenergic receptor-like n=1 Tax=Bacillus rossius redtenbacheri TaxID=93214 RepID=UPI002FDE8873